MVIVFNEEIREYFKLFHEQFHDVVPLRQISGRVTNEQIIDAIKKSLKAKKNLLPEIFGYGDNPDLLY